MPSKVRMDAGEAEDLPSAFKDRLARIYPGEISAVLEGFRPGGALAFRVNLLRVVEAGPVLEMLRDEGLSFVPGPFPPGAFLVPAEERELLTRSACVADGRVLIQNLSSQTAAWVLGSRIQSPRVLDLAAAPGGKTIVIAGILESRGVENADIRAVEPVTDRFYRMKHYLRHAGAEKVKTFRTDGCAVGARFPAFFDAVLCDVPCSSEAVIRRGEPASWSHWSEKKIRSAARLQRRLLDSAMLAVREGGLVLYATCSTAPEENEAVLSDWLELHPGEVCMERVSLAEIEDCVRPGLPEWEGKKFHPDVVRAVRILPGPLHEPFFFCLLRKL